MATKYEEFPYYSPNPYLTNVYGTSWIEQGFVPATAHTITSVKLYIMRYGSSPGTVTVGIRATSTGKPTGNDLCSGTIDGNSLTSTTPATQYEITLGAGYALTAGTKYAIVIRAPNGNTTNFLRPWYQQDPFPAYPADCTYESADSGATWPAALGTYENGTIAFEEWGDPAGLNMRVNIGGVWKAVPSMSVNIGGTWKSVVSVKVNIGGTWKSV